MNRTTIFGITALVVLVALGVYGYTTYKPENFPQSPSGSVSSDANDSAIRMRIEQFGSLMRNISLLSPDAAAQIQAQYAMYAAPELVGQWVANPLEAPGRKTSSPWPDHINIVSVVPKASGAAFQSYQVEANVIEVASAQGGTAPAGVYPVSIGVAKRDGQWMIISWQPGAYSELPQQVTVTGIWECLPHKDRTGPQTMECAFGLAKDQSDGHYAISTVLMSQYPVDFATGTHVRVTGVLTPANQLSSIQKYDIDGVIQATSITKI